MINNKKKLTPSRIKSLQTKEKLRRCALDLFNKHGYDMITIDDIVAKANTSKGVFYNHFKSKDQIIIEIYLQSDQLYIQLFNTFTKNQSASEKLLLIIKLITEENVVMGQDILSVIYSGQIRNGSRVCLDENRPIYRIMTDIVLEGQESGEFINDIPASELAKMLVRCGRGVIYDWCLYEGKLDIVAEGYKFFSIFIKGILKQN